MTAGLFGIASALLVSAGNAAAYDSADTAVVVADPGTASPESTGSSGDNAENSGNVGGDASSTENSTEGTGESGTAGTSESRPEGVTGSESEGASGSMSRLAPPVGEGAAESENTQPGAGLPGSDAVESPSAAQNGWSFTLTF
ncbi:hypothetical protein B0T44_07355 [Nocardia donostiensis]|uniref:Uncharacterized protein n=1 Tax=Nocardia donostiensis TaxID=1538463 RepID=A0A1W0BGI7_9NOCA|nr:hypothetical protein B0T46_14750 [Nocardia donostiensis]OQS21446.1 hypothetical protein B0T44_07355 [Nocardia donostiensis]